MWLNSGISSQRSSERYVGVIEQGFVFENPLADAEQKREGGKCEVRDRRRTGTGTNVPNEACNSHKQSSSNDGIAPPNIESDFVPLRIINIVQRIKPSNISQEGVKDKLTKRRVVGGRGIQPRIMQLQVVKS